MTWDLLPPVFSGHTPRSGESFVLVYSFQLPLSPDFRILSVPPGLFLETERQFPPGFAVSKAFLTSPLSQTVSTVARAFSSHHQQQLKAQALDPVQDSMQRRLIYRRATE